MNPIYKFELTAGETTQRAYPIYKDDLSKDFEKESGQEFFRAKLSGNLTFERDDYEFIVSKAFDTQFVIDIYISYNAGQSWASYWHGTFWKTDCDFDEDSKTVVVKPTVFDAYNDILAGMDKEFNLVELAPAINEIKADKRPMIQVYVPGQSVIGCFLSGMWWEQECTPESDTNVLESLYFALNKRQQIVNITEQGSPTIPDVFMGATIDPWEDYEYVNGDYKYVHVVLNNAHYWRIIRVADDVIMWEFSSAVVPPRPYELTMSPVSGSGASGNVKIYVHEMSVYARFITDSETVSGLQTYEIPDNDIVPNNRNYSRVISYTFPNTIHFSDTLVDTPTEWGLYQPGQYYQQPYLYWRPELFPVARNAWGRVSIWFTFDALDTYVEESGRKAFTIRNAYPISAVLRAILKEIAPNIDFSGNYRYSQFLYPQNNQNPISWFDFRLFIVPKSNIVTSGYDQPAQKAPIKLRDVFDMLRDCFRCYWYIDGNSLHIEHIQYFRNGGSYSDAPEIGIYLTTQEVTRNGKKWAFARNQYKFEKPEMASRYQFGWMDDVTQLFEGFPINILSKYVDPEKIEQITVSKFTSDIDYVLLNPNEVSKDGFVLLGAIDQDGGYALPYYNFLIDGNKHILQNAYVAFCLLQQYYAYDMPAYDYEINGVQMRAQGVKKLKVQNIRFPALTDPDLVELVQTDLGNGTIEKLSLNLSSRNANATLRYDTE